MADELMKYRVRPKLPDYPGAPMTYPKFSRTDVAPPSEHEKLRALLKLTAQELGLLSALASQFDDKDVFRRLQIRQLSSLLDALLKTLNYRSFQKMERGELTVSEKELRRLKGNSGLLDDYRASIKTYARAMGVPSPLGGQLQIRGALTFWPALRSRVTHPKTLERYQFTACDIAIVQAAGKWINAVQDWALQLQLQEVDAAKRDINNSLDALRQKILGDTKRSH